MRHVPSLDISRSTRSRNEMHVEEENRLGMASSEFTVNLAIEIQWVFALIIFDRNGWRRALLSSRVKPQIGNGPTFYVREIFTFEALLFAQRKYALRKRRGA